LNSKIIFCCNANRIDRCLLLARSLTAITQSNISFFIDEVSIPKVNVLYPKNKVFSYSNIGTYTDELINTVNNYSPDIVVIDNGASTADYMSLIKDVVPILVTIDDIGPGRKNADLQINTLIQNNETLYEGYEYLLLQNELNINARVADDVSNVLIAFEEDTYNDKLMKYLRGCIKYHAKYNFHCIIAEKSHPSQELASLLKNTKNIFLYLNEANERGMIPGIDIAIVSGETMMFQIASMGIPTIIMPDGDLQVENASMLERGGSAINAGLIRNFSIEDLLEHISNLAADKNRRLQISSNAKLQIDGLGANRVAELIVVINKLEWDTKHFKKNIAYLYPKTINKRVANYAIKKSIENDIDCLYYLCNCHDPLSVQIAEKHGFHFVDIRLTFSLSLSDKEKKSSEKGIQGPESNSIIIRKAEVSDQYQIKEIAKDSYIHSRYFFDKHFPIETYKIFYSDWIGKSISGQFDDIVFAAEINGEAVGYISCRIQNNCIGSIGLVGVSKEHAGKKIGTYLLDTAVKWFHSKGVVKINVVTQGRNIPAQRLYQSCGFKTTSTELWYHKWFNNDFIQ
jgi:dTDP-4-amino-4,6-dideoxy-D-galactose acyltransferase